jgi:Cu2+-exporting ATPase
MSETAQPALCFQCEAAIDHDPIVVTMAGSERAFCCEGCRQAAEKIHDLELHDFYRYRDKFAEIERADVTVSGGQEKRVDGRVTDDRRVALTASAREIRGGHRISVRVPDIRCAACTWLIESSLRKRPDVTRCVTNLADRVVTIDYRDRDPLDLVDFIGELGFTVLPDRAAPARERLAEERKSLLARLGVAGIGMMQVMMYAFATYVAGDGGIEPAYEALMRWASLVVVTPIAFYSAMPFHRGAIRDLKHLAPGMDVPVSLAILAAYLLSVINTIGQSGEVYYDSVSMFAFLLLIGRFVELGSRQRYQQSQILSDSLLPASAMLTGGRRIPVANVVVGDVVIVQPGESIPVDGLIVEGKTSVAEAAFTGESKPIDKLAGSKVLAGSDNLEGGILVRATAAYQDFVITRISDLYRESTSYKPRFSVTADIVARYFVTGVLLTAACSAAWWYFAGLSTWFSVGLAVLVVSCPCALSLATPVAYTVAVSAMRNNGIVIANGVFLERLTTAKHRGDRVAPRDG